jgi:hypothetical protein
MRIRIDELRYLIREVLGGSHPSEAYDRLLDDDPALDKPSVWVRDEDKRKIRKWMRAMGLSTRKGRKAT